MIKLGKKGLYFTPESESAKDSQFSFTPSPLVYAYQSESASLHGGNHEDHLGHRRWDLTIGDFGGVMRLDQETTKCVGIEG
jgi:hypothetical protein